MKIQPKIEIFGDPEFCCSNYLPTDDHCKKLEFGKCTLFGKSLRLDSHNNSLKYKKCDQCEDEFEKAKENQSTWHKTIICQKCRGSRTIYDRSVYASIVMNGGVYICPKCEEK